MPQSQLILRFFPTLVALSIRAISRARNVNKTQFEYSAPPIGQFVYETKHLFFLPIVRRILGDDMQLGSIASNTIFSGGSGQEPHIDYPYWDYYNKEHWPFPPKHKGCS